MLFVALMWAVYIARIYYLPNWAFLGIFPRTEIGLLGILCAPLLHGSPLHLVSNTFPILILGTTMYFFYPRAADRIFFLSYIGTNILVWIFARPSIHIGASGVVYGIAFFLFFIGFFRKDFMSIVISLTMAALYGGIIYGIFPGEAYVSWESHFFGALVGLGCSFYFRRNKK